MDLEAILEKHADGSWDFDRTQLLSAVREEEVVPQEHRLQVYQWLLMGDSIPSGIPDTFEDYTKEAAAVAAEADGHSGQTQTTKMLVDCTAELIAASPMLKADPSLDCELSGMIYFLCKKTGRQFQKSFLSVIGPLLTLAYSEEGEKTLHVAKLFPLLYAIIGDYLPEVAESNYSTATTEVVRLSLQYHDPEISFHLDRSHVTIGKFVVEWWASMFSTLFAASAVSCDVLSIWDWLFIEGDAVLTAFIPLVFVMEKRRELLSHAGKDEVHNFLQTFSAENIFASPKEVLMKARLLHKNTPFSARRVLKRLLFPASSTMQLPDPDSFKEYFLTFVALPIDASELVDTFSCQDESSGSGMRPAHLNFVILDCRAEKSFNFARLPTALHVGNDIGFDPKLLDDMVKKFDNARGSHLCILGTGRELEQELNLLKIIALHFIQAGFKHVGFADGGFKSCIPHIKAGKIEVVRSPGAEAPTAPASKKVATAGGDTSPPPQGEEHTGEKLRAIAGEAKASAAKVASGMSGWLKSWTKKEPSPAPDTSSATSSAGKSPSTAGTKTSSQVLVGRDELNSSPTKQEAPTTAPARTGSADAPKDGSSSSPSAPSAPPSSGAKTQSQQQLFTLGDGDDDDDDDFELITSVTPVTAAPPTSVPAPPAPATAETKPDVKPDAKKEEPTPVVAETKAEVVAQEKADEGKVEDPAAVLAPVVPAPVAPTPPAPPTAAAEEKHPFDDIFD